MIINYKYLREVGVWRWMRRSFVRQFYKRILRRPQRFELRSGDYIYLPVANGFATELYVTSDMVDWGSEHLLFSLLVADGAFLDVGAHIGYYSLYMSGRSTFVYSFEPDPRVRRYLLDNVLDNNKIEVVPCAVGDSVGVARFELGQDAALSHLLSESDKSLNVVEVDVVTIDVFVLGRGVEVEAIKIDAEGYDFKIIMGARTVLVNQRPIVLTEAKLDVALIEFCADVGYELFAYVRGIHTRRKSFVRLDCDVLGRGGFDTKMIFMIPSEKVDLVLARATCICS